MMIMPQAPLSGYPFGLLGRKQKSLFIGKMASSSYNQEREKNIYKYSNKRFDEKKLLGRKLPWSYEVYSTVKRGYQILQLLHTI